VFRKESLLEFVLGVFILAATCLAQSGVRSLSGVLTDKGGNTLPGSAVELENTNTLSVRSYITGRDGIYHFSGLSNDVDYVVKVKYRSFWSKPKTLSKFNSATSPKLNLVVSVD
jgi:hypothetical protein